PIQRWFFDQDLAEPHHFNQSVLLEVRPGVDRAMLQQVIQEMVHHHEALRLRFERQASGWKQVFTGVDEAVSVTRVSLIDVFDAELTAAISKAADEFQSSLNLSEGPLMRAVLFDFGEERPGRLLLVIHHLLVDGVSWRILLEDLHIGYEHLRRGEEIKFPPRTTSFKRWSERLN